MMIYSREGCTTEIYHYMKNSFGDVTDMYSASQNFKGLYGTYAYNAYGEFEILTNNRNAATLNPFRYGGYYYDSETGYYYLQTRYYDPQVGRFINADSIAYLDPKKINGCNLYAYCLNSPAVYSDDNGMLPIPIWETFVGFAKDIFIGMGKAILSVSEKALATARAMPMFILDDIGGAVIDPVFYSRMAKATNMNYTGKIFSALGKFAKIAGYALLAVDIGLSIYNNFTNPNLTDSRKITDSIIDVGVSLGSFIFAASLGGKVGAFIGGPVGMLVGAVVGAVIGIGVWAFQTYAADTYNYIKEEFNTIVTQTIPNAWDSLVDGWNNFWSFSWI